MRLQPIIIPGWRDSGPDHWQSLWEQSLPRATRVRQASWDQPSRTAWVGALARAIESAVRPPLLIAHSLGCITVAHLSLTLQQRVAGALLVAPADVERHRVPDTLAGFAPIPRHALPFPSMVVASSDDPYCSLAQAEHLAQAWSSELIVLEQAGHINAASGLGDWPQGLRLLARLRRRCCWRVAVPVSRVAAMP